MPPRRRQLAIIDGAEIARQLLADIRQERLRLEAELAQATDNRARGRLKAKIRRHAAMEAEGLAVTGAAPQGGRRN